MFIMLKKGRHMNDFDRENIEHLLTCSNNEFNEWANAMDSDTLLYTIKLIQQAKIELALEELELMETIESETSSLEDLAEANAVLSRFTLKG
jgi:hypothetical protein